MLFGLSSRVFLVSVCVLASVIVCVECVSVCLCVGGGMCLCVCVREGGCVMIIASVYNCVCFCVLFPNFFNCVCMLLCKNCVLVGACVCI